MGTGILYLVSNSNNFAGGDGCQSVRSRKSPNCKTRFILDVHPCECPEKKPALESSVVEEKGRAVPTEMKETLKESLELDSDLTKETVEEATKKPADSEEEGSENLNKEADENVTNDSNELETTSIEDSNKVLVGKNYEINSESEENDENLSEDDSKSQENLSLKDTNTEENKIDTDKISQSEEMENILYSVDMEESGDYADSENEFNGLFSLTEEETVEDDSKINESENKKESKEMEKEYDTKIGEDYQNDDYGKILIVS